MCSRCFASCGLLDAVSKGVPFSSPSGSGIGGDLVQSRLFTTFDVELPSLESTFLDQFDRSPLLGRLREHRSGGLESPVESRQLQDRPLSIPHQGHGGVGRSSEQMRLHPTEKTVPSLLPGVDDRALPTSQVLLQSIPLPLQLGHVATVDVLHTLSGVKQGLKLESKSSHGIRS